MRRRARLKKGRGRGPRRAPHVYYEEYSYYIFSGRALTLHPSLARQRQRQRLGMELASSPLPPATGAAPGDDPCWGGPDPGRHDLRHLLRCIDGGSFDASRGGRHGQAQGDGESGSGSRGGDHQGSSRPPRLILHEDANYVALSKPPDLRMDGPHPSTVHKLLTYWYPPPSLASEVAGDGAADGREEDEEEEEENEDEDEDEKDQGRILRRRRDLLLERVEKLAVASDLPDAQLRPAHQLDYATSGVLLIARTRAAAAAAGRAFERRLAIKEYVAVVEGHVGPREGEDEPSFPPPALPPSALAGWTDGTTERTYRKRRAEGHKGTFLGYMPPHSVLAKWQGAVKRRRKAEKAGEEKAGEGGEDGDSSCGGASCSAPAIVPRPEPPLSPEAEDALLGMKWKEAKRTGYYADVVREMAARYNSSIAARQKEEEEAKARKDPGGGGSGRDALQDRPGEGRAREALPTVFRIEGEDADSFYVHAPLAEAAGHFRVYLHPSSVPAHPHGTYYTSCPADRTMDYKPSLTRVTVLWRGSYQGRPVTKLSLQPRTGRRHQLRLHAAAMGHPILGDRTYQNPSAPAGGGCHRMCLHALRLKLPLLGGRDMSFLAPDPFQVGDGEGDSGSGLFVAGAQRSQKAP